MLYLLIASGIFNVYLFLLARNKQHIINELENPKSPTWTPPIEIHEYAKLPFVNEPFLFNCYGDKIKLRGVGVKGITVHAYYDYDDHMQSNHDSYIKDHFCCWGYVVKEFPEYKHDIRYLTDSKYKETWDAEHQLDLIMKEDTKEPQFIVPILP